MVILSKIQKDTLIFTHCVSTYLTTDYLLHCHGCYELYYLLEGDVDYIVEDRGYHLKPHSLLLLSPNAFHGIKINSTRPYRRVVFHFSPTLLSPSRREVLLSTFASPTPSTGIEVLYQNGEDYQIDAFIQAFIHCSSLEPTLQDDLLPIYMEALLSQLVIMNLSSSTIAPDYSTSTRISEILTYLNNHLTEPIHLDELSERFFISKHHLNKVFRQTMGTTIYDYILHKRIIYAQKLLANGLNATEVAYQIGFKDYSSFYRAYLKILGHSPIKDRESSIRMT